MSNKCDNVISLKQYGNTCWFNSILMSILYSDGSRKLLLEKSKSWDKKIAIYKTIHYILKNKYLRTDNVNNDYAYFDKIRPETILKQLYNHNNNKFNFDPEKNRIGYLSAMYIRKVYKLLGIKVLFLDKIADKLYYSLYNNAKLYKTVDKNGEIHVLYNIKELPKILYNFNNPDVIIVHTYKVGYSCRDNRYPEHYSLNESGIINSILKRNGYNNFITQITDLKTNILFNKEEYEQDSALLCNWNQGQKGISGHSIAGITCRDDKYVYNGWTRTTIDENIDENNKLDIKIPCELMRFDWDLNKNNDFCLNRNKCILDIMDLKKTPDKLCFSFNKGERDIIYVRKNKNSNLDIKKNNDCGVENVINPLTNRCIKIKTINKIRKNPLSKPEIHKKICPEGTVLNPITNRCNKVKIDKAEKVPKICPEGTVLNPITNRCNKVKIDKAEKVPKICPEGTVLNPKTNRCNKVKIDKPEKVLKVCPEGTVLNPKTNRCNKVKIDKPEKVPKVCPEGTVLNPKTNRCNKIKK